MGWENKTPPTANLLVLGKIVSIKFYSLWDVFIRNIFFKWSLGECKLTISLQTILSEWIFNKEGIRWLIPAENILA